MLKFAECSKMFFSMFECCPHLSNGACQIDACTNMVPGATWFARKTTDQSMHTMQTNVALLDSPPNPQNKMFNIYICGVNNQKTGYQRFLHVAH